MLVVTSSSGRGHPIPHPSASRHSAGSYPAHPGGDAPRGAHGLHPATPPSQMMHRLPHPGGGGGGHYPPGGGGPPGGYHPLPSPPPGSMVTLDRSSQQHLRGGQSHPLPPPPPGPPHSHPASAPAPGLGLMKR